MSSDPSAAPELAIRPSLLRARRRRFRHLDPRRRPARRQRLVLRPALLALQPPRPDQRDRRLGRRRVRARRVRADAPDRAHCAGSSGCSTAVGAVLPAVRDARRGVPRHRCRPRRDGVGPRRAGRGACDGRRRARRGATAHGWPRAFAVGGPVRRAPGRGDHVRARAPRPCRPALDRSRRAAVRLRDPARRSRCRPAPRRRASACAATSRRSRSASPARSRSARSRPCSAGSPTGSDRSRPGAPA